MPSTEQIGVRQAAQILGVHPNTVRNWAHDGKLRSSKLPDSGYLRFRRSDVEALSQEPRGVTTPLARGRSLIGPELVDAGQLHQWAEQKFADPERNFPELIRRLVQATPEIAGLSMATGKSVSYPGWDGTAHSTGSTYLPAGNLVFEIGVDARPAAKALKEYKKRIADGSASADQTFVFVTPRLWSGKAAWARKRKAEQQFADVWVLDADDIAAWLTKAREVHIWISEALGRRPRDVQSIARWWESFSSRTDPDLSGSLFLAGRSDAVTQLESLLADVPRVVTVAARSRDEAMGFLAAVALPTWRSWVVVDSAAAWDRLVAETSPGCVLIPRGEGFDIGGAVNRGHHVVIPSKPMHRARNGNDVIEVPAPRRDELFGVLRRPPWSLDLQQADELAGRFRRSFPAFLRTVARDPTRRQPPWANNRDATTLASLVLVGAWDARISADRDQQRAALENLVGADWREIEACLSRWLASDDPPFVRIGESWVVAALDDVFAVLSPSLTASIRDRWEAFAVEVLTQEDPAFEMPPSERIFVTRSDRTPKYSESVRKGVAQGVAFLGASSDDCVTDGRPWAATAERVVRQVLSHVANDRSGRAWQSLGNVMRYLSEAAPNEFLEFIRDDLESPVPLLVSLFQDGPEVSGLYVGSPHVGLLHALECLSWGGEHLMDAGRLLAALAAADPGGTMMNRPVRSLAEILHGRIRNTGASYAVKLALYRGICRDYPNVGWELSTELLTRSRRASFRPCSPVFRDWQPHDVGVDRREARQFASDVIGEAVKLLTVDRVDRSCWITEHLPVFGAEDLPIALAGLRRVAKDTALTVTARHEFWEAVRDTIAMYRCDADAPSRSAVEVLEQLGWLEHALRDETRVDRFAHLFGWHPQLADVSPLDGERWEQRVHVLRSEAIETIWSSSGIDGFAELARVAPNPQSVGESVANRLRDRPDVEHQCLAWAESEDEALVAAAQGWAVEKFRHEGLGWFEEFVAQPVVTSEGAARIAVAAFATAGLWDLLDDLGGDLADRYWQRVHLSRASNGYASRAARELLARGRAWSAIDLIAGVLMGDAATRAELSDDVLRSALSAACEQGDSSEEPSQYAVERVLDELRSRSADVQTLARYEFQLLPLFRFDWKPRALHAALAVDPSLFVTFVSAVFRDDENQPSDEVTEQNSIERMWDVLARWDRVPGLSDEGTVDRATLLAWVRAAREQFRESLRTDIGDDQIGQILSASPVGEDGHWPSEAVRDAIETVASKTLDNAFVVGVENRRGVTSRGVFDGGQQERELADRYVAWSDAINDRWPRTARLLRQIARDYLDDARRHDDSADERHGAP